MVRQNAGCSRQRRATAGLAHRARMRGLLHRGDLNAFVIARLAAVALGMQIGKLP